MNNQITSNSILRARSVCDSNCVFTLEVIERKGNFARVRFQGSEKRVKIRRDDRGEFLMPEKYSMAPIFRA